MTKSFNLHKDDGDWLYKAEVKILSICTDFVKQCYGSAPNKITITASTEEITDAIKILVQKHGFYRWSWTNKYWQGSGGGMYGYVEDQLNKLFPDAREDGKDEPKEVWIKFSK